MQRDLDLIKKILLKIELTTSLNKAIHIEIDGYSKNEIDYHVVLLSDSRYVEAQKTVYGVLPYRITSSGHDFLESSKNDTIWNKAKSVAKEKGVGLTLDLFKELLASLIKSSLGLK